MLQIGIYKPIPVSITWLKIDLRASEGESREKWDAQHGEAQCSGMPVFQRRAFGMVNPVKGLKFLVQVLHRSAAERKFVA